MSTPRRRIVRPQTNHVPSNTRLLARIARIRAKIELQEQAHDRWKKKFKRAFNALDKCNRTIIRLRQQLAQLEKLHEGH